MYKHVAPVAGVKQGQYEPVQVIVAPKRQQILNLGVDYAPGKNTLLKAEVATSNNDVNTFSSKHNGDDRGWASKIQLNNTKLLKSSKQLELISALDY